MLLLAPGDNIAIATSELPAGTQREIAGPHGRDQIRRSIVGHKFAVRAITAGERIVKYGAPIGRATRDIDAGEYVHTHNMTSDYLPTYTLEDGKKFIQEVKQMINGYLRNDGRKGIRNTIVVAYLVECAHHVAREIVYPFREQGVHLIGFPGCYPNAYSHKMMERLCTHPNVGAALLVSLGCEGFNKGGLLETIRKSGRPAALVGIQDTGGTRKTHRGRSRRGSSRRCSNWRTLRARRWASTS